MSYLINRESRLDLMIRQLQEMIKWGDTNHNVPRAQVGQWKACAENMLKTVKQIRQDYEEGLK